MNSDKDKHKDFVSRYYLNKDKLPDDFNRSIEEYLELAKWWYEELPAWLNESTEHVKKLMLEQFPIIKTSHHPVIVTYLHEMNETYMWRLHFAMRAVLKEQKKKINLPKKYPRWKQWKEFYGKPEEPHLMTDKLRNPFLHKDDAEWEKLKAEENRNIIIIHAWQEKRKQEFYDAVYPLLLKHFPLLNELDGDHLLNFGIRLRDNYEEWKYVGEHLETVLEYGMPPETLDLDTDDFQKAFHPYFLKDHRRLSAERHKRIFGEGV